MVSDNLIIEVVVQGHIFLAPSVNAILALNEQVGVVLIDGIPCIAEYGSVTHEGVNHLGLGNNSVGGPGAVDLKGTISQVNGNSPSAGRNGD